MAKGEDKIDVPFTAPWTDGLKHRPDPNRVGSLQIPTPGVFEATPSAQTPTVRPPDPATATAAMKQPQGAARVMDPNLSRGDEPSYYDISPLKRPLWKWEIATYFFLGGLSSGAYLIGRAAERFGGYEGSDVSKLASYLALLSILPAPPLLIHDLGDPKRFHHMLRIWKPENPMNLGTWAITGYGGVAAIDAVRHYLAAQPRRVPWRERERLERLANNGKLLLVQDAAGVPLALIVASYTGVLLSTTSNPLWCKNPWLSPLFVASAMSTGAEAIMLALDATGRGESSAHRSLRRLDTIAHLAEFACMLGFQKAAGDKAKPLHTGKMAATHHVSLGSLIASELLKVVPVPPGLRQARRMLSSTLGLLGGFAMRWAFIYGAHEAADDPHTARLVSKD